MNVFVTSPWVPPEWILAHGFHPRAISSLSPPDGIGPAAGVCAYAETVLRHAELETRAAFVFTTHCDQLRRSYDALSSSGSSRAFLFNLPATTGSAAQTLFRAELERLNRWLMSLGGRSPCPNGIGQLLRDYEISRRRLRNAASRCLARPYAEALLRFHSEGCVALPPTAHARSGTQAFSAVPLALVGGPFTPQYWSLLDEIEKAGGSIVLNATDAGERSLGADPPAAQPDPASNPDLESLSRLFLNRVVDVFQRPNDRFYQWMAGRLVERRVRGIILWHFLACDLWRAERRTLEDRFRLPVLMLEADDTKGGGPRNKTRVQAFLESLTHRPTS